MVRKKRNAKSHHPTKRRKIQSREEEVDAALIKIRNKIKNWPRGRSNYSTPNKRKIELKFSSLVNLVKNSKNVAISIDCAQCLSLVGVRSEGLSILQDALRENEEEKRLHKELFSWSDYGDYGNDDVQDVFVNQIKLSKSDKAIAMCARSLFLLEQDKIEEEGMYYEGDLEGTSLQHGSIIWNALEKIQDKTIDDRALCLLVKLYSPIDKGVDLKEFRDELQRQFEDISEEVIQYGSTESILSMAKLITSFGESYSETSFKLIKRGLQLDPKGALPAIEYFFEKEDLPKLSDKIFIYESRLQIVQMRSACYAVMLEGCTQYAELYEVVKDLKGNFAIQGESPLKKIFDRFAKLTPGYKALVRKLYPNSYQAVKEFANNQTQWFTAFVLPFCEEDFPVQVTKCILDFMYFID